MEMKNMSEKSKSRENCKKTGEVVGKGLEKGFVVAKGIGSGLKKYVKGDDKKSKDK